MDIMLPGPFGAVESCSQVPHHINQNQAEVVEEVEFELTSGLIGMLIEWFAPYHLKSL
jgi:hypothetical protein